MVCLLKVWYSCVVKLGLYQIIFRTQKLQQLRWAGDVGCRVENHWGRLEYRGMEKAWKNLSPLFKQRRQHVPHMLLREHGSEIALSGSAAVCIVPPCCQHTSRRRDLEQTCSQEKDSKRKIAPCSRGRWGWISAPESNSFLVNLHPSLVPQLLVLVWTNAT